MKDLPQILAFEDLGIEMIFVQGGTFMMGYDPKRDGEVDYYNFYSSLPLHEVKINDFYISKTPVTQFSWEKIMGENPSWHTGLNKPVERVSWDDCQVFTEKLYTITQYKFRLPTEEEWEYAARGGNKSLNFIYSGSNNPDEVAWHQDNSNGLGLYEVATKKPNELGIYDMSGNIQEWTSSFRTKDYTKTKFHQDQRVVRGGAHNDKIGNRIATRFWYYANNYRNPTQGLRLALSLE